MSSAKQIIDEALANNIVLYLKKGRLAASGKNFPDSLKGRLAEHQGSIIEYLQNSERAQSPQEFRIPKILPRSAGAQLPLSFAQQRLWFLVQLEGVRAAYHIPATLRLRGALDTFALRRALDALFTRHEALRTVFVAVDGHPHVELLPAQQPFHLVEYDLQGHSDPSAELAQLSREEALTPFDLTHGPLVRGRLVRLADSDHILLLTQHHIVSDGWSIGILANEFSALYGAFTEGLPDPLPPLAVQYPDYAVWQRQWLTQERLAEQLDYWYRSLTDAPVQLALPTDRPRSASPSYAGAAVPIYVDAALTRGLKRIGQQHDTTLFITLMAAWAGVLGRLSGQEDVVIGTLSANRSRHEIEPLIGFFVNTLALRIDLSGDPSVASLLDRVRTVALAAQDHQDVPFEQVVERVNPPRKLEHTPLFQVLFAWQSADRGTLDLPNLQVEMVPTAVDRIEFDLKLILSEVGDTIQGSLGYATDLFDAATIERHAGYLLTVLKAVAAQADQPIAGIDLLSLEERTLLLKTWNATAAPYPQERCIHQLFEQQVQQNPYAPALVFEDQTLSYGDLNSGVNRLAWYLIEQGVQPDDRVAICVERSFAMVTGLLAILKAGGAYVPLDPADPSARLAHVLADADPAVVVIDSRGRAALGKEALHGRTVLDLDHPHPAWVDGPDTNPDSQALGLASRHLAYVIYTSGSTGIPKGAQNEHRALINRLVWMQEAYHLDANDVVLQKTPFNFDVSVWEFFWTLLNGATLVIAPPAAHKDPSALIELVVRHRVTTAHFVPSMLAGFLRTDGVERCTSLQRLICSGEALPGASVRLGQQRLPHVSLYNLYGPTEAAIDVTAWTCPASFSGEVVPIGRPIANTRIYLLDAYDQPVPLGAMGELYIGGAGIARGYLHRPELTAKRFLPDPFCGDPDARMYRTGDLARYLPDGNLLFLGRNDHQVKLRGFRIELGEIEARLAEHPDVHDATVVALGDDTKKRLVAYVVLRQHSAKERDQDLEARQVNEWQDVYESVYREAPRLSLGEDFNVWKSSYTGQPIPLEEMHEWRRATVERIAALRPRRLLEIGVGSGLLLACLAADCEAYWATDFSQATIDKLRSQLTGHVHLATKVQLRTQAAHEVDELPRGFFDTIVINSVVQHFPNAGYLIDVIQKALDLLVPGGSLFLGDIRNLDLIHSFTSAVQLQQANSGTDTASVRRGIQQTVLAEKELLLAPSFFASLPQLTRGICAVDIQIKRGWAANELSRYRYDVVLRRGPIKTLSLSSVAAHCCWDDLFSLDELSHRLEQNRPVFWRVINVPNARLAGEVEAWRGLRADRDLAAIHNLLENPTNIGVEPETLCALGESLGYRAVMTWSATCPAHFDVIFINSEQAPAGVVWTDLYASPGTPKRDLTAYANNPSRFHQLASLRRHIAQSLPDYMVPAAFVTLDALPLTASGKLDRRALPAPDDDAVGRGAYEVPEGEIETALASLWQELLGLERVGRRDHFFELGGHSLLAVRLRSRLGSAFGVELNLAEIFAHPTVSALAAVIVQRQANDTALLAPITPTSREGVLPISFAQQRLWFVAQLEGVSVIYHIPAALSLRGALDVLALRRALNTVFLRHEALRSVFVTVDGEPQVRLLPVTTELPLIEHDLRGREDASVELARLGKEEARAPFDLTQGPLIRGRLVQLGEEDHVLLLTQHHIVSDGWSIGVLSRELSTLYRAFQQGQGNPLPPLAIQYPDYAAWQRAWLSGERLERQIGYWREALSGAPVLLELPTDRPRQAQRDFSGAHVPLVLDGELTRSLKQLSQRHGTTLFMTVLAAWSAVLSRLSGQEEVVIGTPVANRGRAETEGLIGFFVNTLALRIKLGESPSVGELLSHVRTASLAAQDHQDLPFEQVVEIVQPPRRLNHAPIFQVLFNWDEDWASVSSSGGVEVAALATNYEVSRFDLKLNLSERNGSLHGMLIYATALFDQSTMERHVGYLQAFLRAMVADSGQAVAGIDLLSSEERRLQLETWNATAVPYAQERCIHQLFEDQVRKSPEAPAVVHEDRVLSYGELNAEANRLAHHLIGLGVVADARVAICVERSAAMVIGLLAILKAGGAYVPLDPAYPSERLSQIVTDASPSLVLIDRAGREALGEAALAGWTLVDLEPLREGRATVWSFEAVEDPQVEGLTSRQLAYVIYTSGSTGTPKGVMVEHHSLVNFHQAVQRDIYRRDARLRIGWNASFSFDMSMKGFLQLLSGHALVIIPQEVRGTSGDFLRFLREQAIDGFDVTPSLLKALIGEGLLEEEHPRTVLVGGERIDPALWQQLKSCRRIEFHNMYGPTECTVDATMSVIGSDDAIAHIGRPIANTRIYLLDAGRQPVPLGAIGELYIGGAGVARGYFNRLELTSERFLVDPFAAEAGGRMYRTGDLARYLPDGNIEYLGRNDNQVKIRGFRIELGEVEARLSEHGLVREAVVEARDTGEEKRLVAYVLPEDESIETGDLLAELRAHLATTLPDYMVPSTYVRMEAWPLTPNGKLDRKGLPAPDDEAYVRREYEAPQGEIEETLAELWQELLQVERVGRQDDFFELGGHSLLAVRLLVHIRQSLGAELPMVTLFAQSTLAGLSEAVREAGGGRATQAVLPMVSISRDQPMPLSFAQQRLWFLAQLDGVSATYHIPLSLRIRGALDSWALRRALDKVLARHEGLRSVFVEVDGEPQVRLLPVTTELPLIEHDLRGREDASVELARLGKEEARAPFDLTQGPLIRGRLVQLSEEDHVLLLTQHHIVSDGWSIGVLSRELSTLYRAFQQGQGNPLPPLEIQYPDYAAWQRAWLSGERLERQIGYWREALAGAPVLLELPTDRPRQAQQDFNGARVPLVLDGELTRSLKQLSQRHGATLFMTVLAAWSAVLSRLSGQEEVVIGTPVANRGRAETEGLIGFFVNTLALRIRLGESPSVSELLSRVRTASLAAQDHQDLPFEQVVEIVQPPRRLNHTPIFQVLFNWRNNEVSLPDFPGVQVSVAATAYEVLKFDLELTLSELDGQIAGGLAYATALFDESTMERHVGYLQALLRAMVADSDLPVAGIDVLPAEERRLQLETWNATAAPYAQERCIHQLFEEQVRNSPEAPAVVHEGRVLKYGELNAEANRLAHHLVGLGVVADARVAICVERSAAMVIGLLAILKAGGAYVPLDPAYPSERLSQIVTDASPSLVLIDRAGREALGEAALAGRRLVDLEPLRGGRATVWSFEAVEDPQVEGLTSRHLAYVIYTSGSTGRPKGVMNEHGALVNRLMWMQEAYGLDNSDVVLQKTSFSFDVSVWEFFWTLQQGAKLLVPAPELQKDPSRLIELMVGAGVTTAHFVPSMLGVLLTTRGVERCTSLRRVICSGEALSAQQVQGCREKLPGALLHNLYGPTEAAIDVTAWTCPISYEGGVVPIGRPIANTRIYLLDAGRQPVPLGAIGELYIGGAGVARGYLNRPELTSERFMVDPFSAEAGGRMYRTGDLARYLPDGNIEYLGRNDNQVKIRGFRIELGEVEARLSEHALVREAVVEARDTGEEKRLVAYVLPAEESIETGDLLAELRTHLATTLPDYMVPSAYVRMEAWPLTPNGKLDRKGLPAPDDEAYVRREYEAPQGEIEETLAELWQELLQVERVGRQDDFFELGGTSLLAVRIRSALYKRFSIQIELSALFKHSVLCGLAKHLLIVLIEQEFGTDQFENAILSVGEGA